MLLSICFCRSQILVCGTNSYKPKCRDYILKSPDPSASSSATGGEFSLSEEKPGEGLCPYDPNHNSTFTFAGKPVYCPHRSGRERPSHLTEYICMRKNRVHIAYCYSQHGFDLLVTVRPQHEGKSQRMPLRDSHDK